MMITNLAVWTDLATLRAFTYQAVHRYVLQSRHKLFEQVFSRRFVLWRVPVGRVPALGEAKQAFRQLEGHGPSARAFTFLDAFDAAGQPLPRESRSHPGNKPRGVSRN
jgi:hypothetical protein